MQRKIPLSNQTSYNHTCFHYNEGCPSYKDPTSGYAEQGYVLPARGLHRMKDLDRDGNNRITQVLYEVTTAEDREATRKGTTRK
jgi:hypothetical protein